MLIQGLFRLQKAFNRQYELVEFIYKRIQGGAEIAVSTKLEPVCFLVCCCMPIWDSTPTPPPFGPTLRDALYLQRDLRVTPPSIPVDSQERLKAWASAASTPVRQYVIDTSYI